MTSEFVLIAADGSRKVGDISGAPLIKDGKVTGMIAIARDITDRKETEEALRAANAYNRSLIEASIDPW